MRNSLWRVACGVVLVAGVGFNARAGEVDPTNGAWFQFEGFYDWYECFGPSGGSMNNGTNLIEWTCNPASGARDQAWFFDNTDCISNSNGTFCSIRNGMNVNKCMGTYAGSASSGADLVLWDCLGTQHQDQYWQFIHDGETGCYWVMNAKSSLYIDDQWFNVCSRWFWDSSPCPLYVLQDANPRQMWCPYSVTP